ncbi:hypothetical protein [Bradyrhizobium pachyrhizi]|uniref:hypothetical protein n=1 Tax=Bradyrhizobium pachyrhizi TaxID=280333 RepID=UPI001364909A|nr:hypothetical protein [Bradyrhizobium pachyrhizi]
MTFRHATSSPIEPYRIPLLQPLGGQADGILDAIEIGAVAGYCRHYPIAASGFDFDVTDVLSAGEAADFAQRDELKIPRGYHCYGHRSVPRLFRSQSGSIGAVPKLKGKSEAG